MSKLAHSSDDATMESIERQARAVEDKESQAMAEAEDRSEAHVPTGLELVVSKALSPVQVFTANGLDPILERIERETRSIALDISSPKGRKEIASLAHKIAQSKTALDKAGKDLVAGWKEQAKKVDVERARAWDRLEALQKEIRQPLTEWEDREKNRVARHEASLTEIFGAGTFTTANWQGLSVEVMQDRLAEIQKDAGRDWEEFSVKAKQAIETTTAAITAAILKRQKHDAEQAELARLRKEEEERKQRAHEEHIARAAAEQARLLAEEEARKVAEAEAARVAAEKAKAEQERHRIQREKEQAEAAARRAEEEKNEAIARAERERIAAAEKAKRLKAEADARAAKAESDRSAAEKKAKEDAHIAAEKAATDQKAAEDGAAKRERDRIEAERKAEAEATAKRESDKAHKAKIDNEALNALLSIIFSDDPECMTEFQKNTGKNVVRAIAKGQIPHIKITY